MGDAADDLRATTEAIRQDAERLATVEAEKQATEPDDSRMQQLSERADELGADIRVKTSAEHELSQEAARERN